MVGVDNIPCQEEMEHKKSIPSTIYHYTSSNGFENIIRNGKPSLFFTQYDCMNDSSEGELIREIVEEAFREYRAANPGDGDFFRALDRVDQFNYIILPQRGMITRYGDGYNQICECTPYVCCFSCDGDSLPMWKYYVKQNGYEGYGIGVDRHRIFNNILIYGESVIYDKDLQKKIILHLIERLHENYHQNMGLESIIQYLGFAYRSELMRNSLRFKIRAFEHEKEYRFILHMPNQISTYKNQYSVEIPPWLSVKYRVNRGIMVPYIDVPIEDSIVEIVVGPFALRDVAYKMLVQYLNKENHKEIVAKKSEIPVRF